MKTRKCKILVLSDLTESTHGILKSSMNLAQSLDADLDFFHVRKPIDVIEQESQLSAMRKLNEESVAIKNQIDKTLEPYKASREVTVNASFSFGHIKNEVGSYLKKTKPDILVLGKRKQKTVGLFGDKIADFVINSFNGSILIASEKNILEPQKDLSIGVLTENETVENLGVAQDLLNMAKTPLKSFRFKNKNMTTDEGNINQKQETIDYVFDENDNSLNGLSNYLSMSKVNLVCVNRNMDDNSKGKLNRYKQIINKVDVPVMIINGVKFGAN